MIICETAVDPDDGDDYYTQLYFYIPTMMCIDLMKNNKVFITSSNRSYNRFKEFLFSILKLL